jgi:hypothetical protein
MKDEMWAGKKVPIHRTFPFVDELKSGQSARVIFGNIFTIQILHRAFIYTACTL